MTLTQKEGTQLYSSLSAQVPDGFVDEDSSMLGGNFGCELIRAIQIISSLTCNLSGGLLVFELDGISSNSVLKSVASVANCSFFLRLG